MKIYAIEYIYERGNHYTRFYEDEEQRNHDFEYEKKWGPQICIRKRDFEEIIKEEDDEEITNDKTS